MLAYGATKDEAEAAVEALALRVIADQIETEKVGQKSISFATREPMADGFPFTGTGSDFVA